MYCPQCGQEQVSDVIRYCSRCGFLLEGVTAVLAAGGAIPTRYLQPGNKKLSARSKGVRQGALLMLSTLLVVPIVAILSVNLFWEASQIIIPLAALFCFVGGLLRVLYALLMEDSTPQIEFEQRGQYVPASPQFERPGANAALPPAAANPAPSWRPRPTTAEIYQPPPSITENTTRLLDKDEADKR